MKAIFSALVLMALPLAAAAQESIALAVEGWRAETRNDITYYRCASSHCAAGSEVSYKRQPHRTTVTIVDFENHHRGLVTMNKERGHVHDARISDVKQRIVEGVRVMQVSRVVESPSGKTTYSIEARLIGPDKSFSLVSDSPRRDYTANNFEVFLRQLVNIAAIKGLQQQTPLVPAKAGTQCLAKELDSRVRGNERMRASPPSRPTPSQPCPNARLRTRETPRTASA